MTTQETRREVKQEEKLMTGTQAVAQAVQLADVDVTSAYPIRPYDGVMQAVAKLIADGELECEYIVAEGEHSQFEICKHASAVGSPRVRGLLGRGLDVRDGVHRGHAALRLPVVAMVGNRALDDPGAFGVEHNDALCVRDLGWQLFWVENAQECFDATLHGLPRRRGPAGSPSLSASAWTARSSRTRRRWSRSRTRRASTPSCRPTTWGTGCCTRTTRSRIAPQANEDWVMEIRKQNDEAAKRVKDVIREAYADFKELFGRGGDNPFFEEYMTEDAEYVLVGMGSLGLPAKVMVRRLREQGEKVGFVRLKWFRPFPDEELAEVLGRFKAVGVVDRDYSYGSPQQGGVLFTDLRAALYDAEQRPRMVNFIGGLGGREVTPEMMDEMADLTRRAGEGEDVPVVSWIGVRE